MNRARASAADSDAPHQQSTHVQEGSSRFFIGHHDDMEIIDEKERRARVCYLVRMMDREERTFSFR